MAGQQSGGYQLGRRNRRLDDWALRLWGDIAQGADKPTFFYIDFRYTKDGKFRDIELGVNFRKQGKEGKLKIYPPQSVFFAFTKQIKDMVEKPEKYPVGFGRMYDSMTNFGPGGRQDTPYSDMKLMCGKDEEGIWVAITKKGHDQIKCRFNAPMNWVLRDIQGKPLTASEVSHEMAYSIIDQWEDNIKSELNNNYLDDSELEQAKAEKKAAAFGGGKGGQGGGQQSGWGQPKQQQQPAVQKPWVSPPQQQQAGGEPPMNFDDDLPF